MNPFAEADARLEARRAALMAKARACAARDAVVRDAVARAAAPGLIAMIEAGQRLNDPNGSLYRDKGKDHVWFLLRIIEDYRFLMRAENEGDEYDRATAALACGHGYTLTDSCPRCEGQYPDTPGCSPLIALVRTYDEDAES